MAAIPPAPAQPNFFPEPKYAPQNLAEQLMGTHTPLVTTPLPDASDVSHWTSREKLQEAASMGIDMMPKALGDQIKPLLTPDNLKMLAGGAAVYGAAHYFGAGEVADVALAGAGLYALGKDTGKFLGDARDFYQGATNAQTQGDLHEAAKKFADGASLLMTDMGLGAAGAKGASAIREGAQALRESTNVAKVGRALFTGTMATIAGNVVEPKVPVLSEKPPIEAPAPAPDPTKMKMNPLFFQENKIRTEGIRTRDADRAARNEKPVEEPDPQGPRAPQAPVTPAEGTRPARKPEDGE